MFASQVFRVSVLVLALAPTVPASNQRIPTAEFDREYTVVSRFLRAAEEYIVQHHRLFEPLSPETLCLPDSTVDALDALAAIPPDARPAPREGGVFLPDVSPLFRRRLAGALRRQHEAERARLLATINKTNLLAPAVSVNQPSPRGIGAVLPPWLGEALPPLPEELAYRLVGRDLVLVDVPSDLVVDVIRTAIVDPVTGR